MLIVGLTGGIGSGKTTVAKQFRELGITIIDSDKIAYDLVKPGSETLKKIVDHFGAEILTQANTLDRHKLRKIIFNHSTEKKWLENLLHPLIRKEIIKQSKQANSAYIVLIIPLLFETHSQNLVTRILVIDTPEEVQIKRTIARDNCSEAHVRKIIASQINRQQRLKQADDVIVNDGNIKSLERQVKALHDYYMGMRG